MTIPVGVLLNSEYSARELASLGRLSEELGYDQLWYTDNRLFRECYLGLGALAAATSRIRLGPGVTDPYSRHAAVTAATMATARRTVRREGDPRPRGRGDQLSRTRFVDATAPGGAARGCRRHSKAPPRSRGDSGGEGG